MDAKRHGAPERHQDIGEPVDEENGRPRLGTTFACARLIVSYW